MGDKVGFAIGLTGDETFSGPCSLCGAKVILNFDEFISASPNGNILSADIFCVECRRKLTDGPIYGD